MGYKGKWKRKTPPIEKALTVIGAILCVIFGAALICNLTIIVKGSIDPESPPSVFGITPLVVLSGSMSGDAPDHIEIGDLIFAGKEAPGELKNGDVIAFKQGKVIVTHRIVEIATGEGGLLFTTQGDANGTPDEIPVPEDRVIGKYMGRIPKVGDFALFLQTPLGMFLFIGVPLLGFIIYDMIRRQRYSAKKDEQTVALEKEIRRLRAIAAEKERHTEP